MKRQRDNDDKPPPNRTIFRESPTFSNPYNNNNVATNSSGTSSNSCCTNNNKDEQHDRFLPIANVGRIMKKMVPGNGKISKEAKEAVQQCVSEFISFVTGEASDKCQREKRKTINGEDILWAIMTLDFQNYVSPLKLYLTKLREIEGERLISSSILPKQQQQQQQGGVDEPRHHNYDGYDDNNNNVYLSTNNMNPGDSMAFSLPHLQNDHLEVNW